MIARLFAALALILVALPASVQVAHTQTAPVSPQERARFEQVIREYLLRNPEVIQEALVELEKRQNEAEARARETALTDNRTRIYRAPGEIVLGNPNGDVTLVEFFDYNCGFCKRALSDIQELIRSDARLRVVLKDYPVLGPGSVEAAQVAVAIRAQLNAQRYFDFHQRLLMGRGQANRARALEVAREIGADMARLERDMNEPRVREVLAENTAVARALGIDGTPTYVVGDEVVVGAVGVARLRDQLVKARAGCGRTANMC